jgi:tetratricopeptide (TPR) repeat protein
VSVGERLARPILTGAKGLSRRAIFVALGAVVLVAGLAVWLGPWAVSLYQQERGGALLDRALALEEYDTTKESWPLVWEPLMEEDARALVEDAAERFQAAAAADPGHAQARRWAGRAALLLDEPLAAAKAFSAYVRQRPENPLGYWELGLAYERLVRWTEGTVHWAVEPGVALSDSMFAADAVVASLDEAEVQTPDVSIGTPYCDEGDAPESCFVTTTTWWMPDAPQETLWTPDDEEDEEVGRQVVFMHPPAEATFTVTLPVTPTALTFWMGIDPAAHGWQGDGVVYRVVVDGSEVFTHTLTAEEARRGWQGARVDLGEWAGEEIRLTLATGAGPAGDGQGDWAGWGDVRVATGDGDAVSRTWVRAAWEEAGVMAKDLIAAGEEAREAQRYAEALNWYDWSAALNPELGDSHYYIGLVYADQRQWELALSSFQAALSDPVRTVGKSDIYYRIGWLRFRGLSSLDLSKALVALNAAIDQNQFAQESAVEAHYQKAELLRQTDRGAQALAEYEIVVRHDPRHYVALLRLGHLLWELEADPGRAEEALRDAISLRPDVKWAYRQLGDIYQNTGREAQAIDMYRKVLELDRGDQFARRRIEELGELPERR